MSDKVTELVIKIKEYLSNRPKFSSKDTKWFIDNYQVYYKLLLKNATYGSRSLSVCAEKFGYTVEELINKIVSGEIESVPVGFDDDNNALYFAIDAGERFYEMRIRYSEEFIIASYASSYQKEYYRTQTVPLKDKCSVIRNCVSGYPYKSIVNVINNLCDLYEEEIKMFNLYSLEYHIFTYEEDFIRLEELLEILEKDVKAIIEYQDRHYVSVTELKNKGFIPDDAKTEEIKIPYGAEADIIADKHTIEYFYPSDSLKTKQTEEPVIYIDDNKTMYIYGLYQCCLKGNTVYPTYLSRQVYRQNGVKNLVFVGNFKSIEIDASYFGNITSIRMDKILNEVENISFSGIGAFSFTSLSLPKYKNNNVTELFSKPGKTRKLKSLDISKSNLNPESVVNFVNKRLHINELIVDNVDDYKQINKNIDVKKIGEQL